MSGNISTATTKNSDLQSTITTANTSKGNLDTSISNSVTAKSNLDGSVTVANTIKTGLDGSVDDGNTLKGELDAIIQGSDFEAIIVDLNSLKQDQHKHTNIDVIGSLSEVGGVLQYKGEPISTNGFTWGEAKGE